MAERHPLRREQRLGLGPPQARLQHGGHRDVVDRDQPLHPHEVEAQHAGVPLARGDQAAGHRRAAPERDDRDVVRDRDREDRGDLVVRAGADDGVGRVGEVALARPEEVGRRLAPGAQPPGLVVGADVLGADDLGELPQHVGGDRRGGEGRWLDRRAVVEPEDHLDQAAGLGRQGLRPGGVTPAGGVHLALLIQRHALHCDI